MGKVTRHPLGTSCRRADRTEEDGTDVTDRLGDRQIWTRKSAVVSSSMIR